MDIRTLQKRYIAIGAYVHVHTSSPNGDYGHGSGDIALAFSTAATIAHETAQPVRDVRVLVETELDPLFEAAAEATEAAIVDALLTAVTVTGFAGHTRYALTDLAPDWAELIR